jgi:hypothetical protein
VQFRNFSIWRGRLPHWRADDVRYFVTFRHRRTLEPIECRILLDQLVKPHGSRWNLDIAAVGTERTELIVQVQHAEGGRPAELSDVVEKAKTRAGKAIVKKTGERFPPFYQESYDRIIRDEAEWAERWQAAFDLPLDIRSARKGLTFRICVHSSMVGFPFASNTGNHPETPGVLL